jgi:hypothetical protein
MRYKSLISRIRSVEADTRLSEDQKESFCRAIAVGLAYAVEGPISIEVTEPYTNIVIEWPRGIKVDLSPYGYAYVHMSGWFPSDPRGFIGPLYGDEDAMERLRAVFREADSKDSLSDNLILLLLIAAAIALIFFL